MLNWLIVALSVALVVGPVTPLLVKEWKERRDFREYLRKG